jgi:hypothetical protein
MRHEERAILWLLDPAQTRRHEQPLVRLLRGDFPWRSFCTQALGAGIAPFIFFQVRRHELGDLLPGWVYERFQEQYEWVALRNGILLRDLRYLMHDLARHGIACTARGTTYLLQHGFYPDRGIRLVDACTLSIAQDKTGQADNRLSALGYRRSLNGGDALWVNERGTAVQVTALPSDASSKFLLREITADARSSLAKGSLVAYLDLWVLAKHHGVTHPHLTAGTIMQALRQPWWDRNLSVLRRLRESCLRLFPARDKMLRRHGKRAVGVGLFTLYATRILGIPKETNTVNRQAPGRTS